MIKKLLIIPPILVGLAVLYFMTSGREAPERNPPTEIARAVRVIAAEPMQLVPRVTGFGSVYPGTVWTGIAQVSGKIEYVHPDLENGAILVEGTEIIRISPVDFNLAIRQAQANIRSAEAKLDELSVTEQNTTDLLKIEQDGLALREAELARKQSLFERGTIARAALDLEQREALAQRKKVQDLENTLRLLPTQRAVQEEQISIYQAQLQSAQLDLERTRIVLPFNGRIADLAVEAEQFIQAGGRLVSVDSIDVAEVEAQIPITQFRDMLHASVDRNMPIGIDAQSLSRILETIGFEATVRLGVGDDAVEWPARFSRISDSVDPRTRTIGAIVAVDGAYAMAVPGERPPLSKGMFVEIEIRTRARLDDIVVPRSAFHDGKLYVVDGDGRLEIRDVTPGLVQGNLVVVTDGIAPGEQVVVSDLIPAISGMLLLPQVDEEALAGLKIEAAGGSLLP